MTAITGFQQHLSVTVVEDSHDATRQGFFYSPPIYLPIQIEKVVVVKNGTEEGKPTVDLILEDEKGQKYVCMVTAALLKMLPI